MRKAECGFRNNGKKQRGVSLIAAIFIIVVLAFMGVMFLSMISRSALTSVNDMQSAQALSIAEGGMEYILENRMFPNYSMGGATINFGAGNFMVSTPTYLTADPGAAGTTITVLSTANFPNAGRIIIDSELITYTGKNATQFMPATRGVGGTAAVSHPTANAAVFPVTTVTDNPLAIGSTTINVTSNVGFSIPGAISIDTEHIFCAAVNGSTQFTNCTRGYTSSPASAHPNLSNVFQYHIASTGTVGSAQRVVTRNVRQIPGAMMVYAKANGDGNPYYRRWGGTSWGPELPATNVGANIQYLVLKFAGTRNEAILGMLNSNGDIRVQVWNGAAWGGTLLLANIGANDNYRGFDIEYETAGDSAIVVYNDGTADPNFVIWNGLGWTAAANINIPTTGLPLWIELAPNPMAGSNEIALITLDDNSDIYGMRWTGAAWDNMGDAARWDGSAATSATKVIDVAYEQLSGRALFMWGDNNNDDQQYRIWDGATATLTGNTLFTINAMGGEARWIRLASDPGSNQIMHGVQDSGGDLNTALWSGPPANAWATHAEHAAAVEDTLDRNFDIAFETHPATAGQAWLAWGNGGSLSRRQWTGAAWAAIPNSGDDTAMVQLMAHPLSGAFFSIYYEDNTSATDDIWEMHLTSGGAVWSPRFTAWAGPTVGNPVMERMYLGAEHYNPLIIFDWQEDIK
jgi:hypothetical protein